MLASGLLMLILGLAGIITTYSIVVPVVLFAMGAGLTFANAFAGAIHPFPKMAGSAAALFGCIQILGGGLASSVMATIPESNQIPLAIVFTLLGLLALFFLKAFVRGKKRISGDIKN